MLLPDSRLFNFDFFRSFNCLESFSLFQEPTGHTMLESEEWIRVSEMTWPQTQSPGLNKSQTREPITVANLSFLYPFITL